MITLYAALIRQTDPTPFETWAAEKRDEAQRLHRGQHRQWIREGAVPAPRYASI